MSPRIKYALFALIAFLLVILGLLLVLRPSLAPPPEQSVTPAARYFVAQTQARIVREMGQPIEGFEQSMFQRVYPGLTTEDFQNVETFGDTQPAGVKTSADAAITTRGMGTLLENVAWRAGLSIQTQTDIDAVIGFMERVPGNDPSTIDPQPERATLLGTVVCLPHVDTSGPQTLECAYGLKTDIGNYYALDFMLMSQLLPEAPTGKRISANGVFTPIERLSTDYWRNYPIKGIFSVTDSVKIID